MPTEERDLLLYTVLGELYASPLADLHTVVDLDWASVADVTDTIEVQNHQVRMVTMEHVFGEAPPLVTGKANRPMLVVSVESRWVGLVIDDVHGMVETPRITPLPGGLSEFPEELILGAFERPHPAKEHDAEHEEPGDADESTVDTWTNPDDAATARNENSESRIVIVIDLPTLARIALETSA